jgi:membrane protein implicated in regulation of membrane protease activity
MPQPNLKGLVLAGAVTLPVGIVLFIGGIIAIIAKLTALGGVLMAAAVVSLATGCVLMVLLRIRARAYNRDLQARQQTGLDAAFRNYPGGGRLP